MKTAMRLVKLYQLMIMAFGIMLLPGCFSDEHKECCGCPHDHDKIAVANTKLKGLVIIDVLEEKFYKKCHIKGAINVPFEQLEQFATNNIDKDADIVLYCSNKLCTTSKYARDLLSRLGFNHVSELTGGIAEFYHQGGEVEGTCIENKDEPMPAYLAKKPVAAAQELKEAGTITSQELKNKIERYKESLAA